MEKKVGAEMNKVWIVADSVISPMGVTGRDNFNAVVSGNSGLVMKREREFGTSEVCMAYCNNLNIHPDSTRFETLSRMAITELKNQISIPTEKTIFILSTTKGNIELLEKNQENHPRKHLDQIASMLTNELGIKNHIVISNACTSGVSALILAKRQIECGHYHHAVVLGADALNRFIISGFQSLNALSPKPCKPFDANRVGINLGEASAAVFMTSKPEKIKPKYRVALLSGAICNDANHISGPSKTGEELSMAINKALAQGGVKTNEIDFISAHGTATLYNDEMESKAFHLSKLSDTPTNSLKGNFGHTLGAAGVIESVMSVHSLLNQELAPSLGFENLGVSKPVNIIKKRQSKTLRTALKTSSGFGGCNAAILLQLES